MAKSNNKEKLTYKQMLSYMDFLNSKLNEGYGQIEQRLMGVSACLRSLVLFLDKEEEFQKFLEDQQEAARKAAEDLGSDAQNNMPEMEK